MPRRRKNGLTLSPVLPGFECDEESPESSPAASAITEVGKKRVAGGEPTTDLVFSARWTMRQGCQSVRRCQRMKSVGGEHGPKAGTSGHVGMGLGLDRNYFGSERPLGRTNR